MAVPVNLFVADDSITPAPIQDALIMALDPVTLAIYATGVTDVSGRAAFLMEAGEYELRLFKRGVIFQNPLEVLIQDPPVTTNDFNIPGTLITLPIAVDPRCCRCTGKFMSLGNKPISGSVVRIMSKIERGFELPKLVDGNMISGEVIALTTDNNGIVSLDLIRGAEYYITFSGEDEDVWNIKVPDRSSVNLIDLIHPRPVLLTWNQIDAPSNSTVIASGSVVYIHYSVLFSDYEVLTKDMSLWLTFINSDDTVIAVSQGDGIIVIEGVSAGTAQVTVQVKPNLVPHRIPDNSIVSIPLSVTVVVI